MLLDDIFANLPESYTQADKDLIEKAYYFAEKAKTCFGRALFHALCCRRSDSLRNEGSKCGDRRRTAA